MYYCKKYIVQKYQLRLKKISNSAFSQNNFNHFEPLRQKDNTRDTCERYF